MVDPTVSLIIPTITRPTLARTLTSLRLQGWTGRDQVLLVSDGPSDRAKELFDQFGYPGASLSTPKTVPSDWGATPRNAAMQHATGDYIAFLDDDDEWLPNSLTTIRSAAKEHPGRPLLFRMRWDGGTASPWEQGILWNEPRLRLNECGTPMIVIPRTLLGPQFGPTYSGDYEFIRDVCSAHPLGPIFVDHVICSVRPLR